MKKHAFTYFFLLIFSFSIHAQLTLQQVNGSKKHTIPVGTSIEMTFPSKTSGIPEAAFHRYQGKLKAVTDLGINVVMTYENRDFIDENEVKIREVKFINPPDTPLITQIPFKKMLSITEFYPKNRKLSNASFYVFAIAVLSNIFVAPHLKAPYNQTVRNAGYIVMGVGLAVAFVPTRHTYYLEQPKNGNKKLWKLVN
jgi:hypothetical protein